MTTPYPTADEHRLRANELLAQVYRDDYAPSHPYRVDMLHRATVHALMGAGPAPRPEVIYVNFHDVDEAQIAQLVQAVAEDVSTTPTPSSNAPQTPRKRAAKKTASKETAK
ncbi:hypothetical protein OG474_09845 [Kribbella sp. NBC_01505]|uniref:hypothetical protein n=1 Tax=Kribbella sp. NBC_01505 TaxID=2903580 RepID=UPI0038684E93